MKKWFSAAVGVAVVVSVVLWYRVDRQKSALLEDAVVAFKSGDYDDAIPVLRAFADEGDLTAARLMALAYAQELSKDLSAESASKYFSMLTETDRSNLCEENIGEIAASESNPLREICLGL